MKFWVIVEFLYMFSDWVSRRHASLYLEMNIRVNFFIMYTYISLSIYIYIWQAKCFPSSLWMSCVTWMLFGNRFRFEFWCVAIEAGCSKMLNYGLNLTKIECLKLNWNYMSCLICVRVRVVIFSFFVLVVFGNHLFTEQRVCFVYVLV